MHSQNKSIWRKFLRLIDTLLQCDDSLTYTMNVYMHMHILMYISQTIRLHLIGCLAAIPLFLFFSVMRKRLTTHPIFFKVVVMLTHEYAHAQHAHSHSVRYSVWVTALHGIVINNLYFSATSAFSSSRSNPVLEYRCLFWQCSCCRSNMRPRR